VESTHYSDHVLGSNAGPHTNYPDSFFWWFSLIPPDKYQIWPQLLPPTSCPNHWHISRPTNFTLLQNVLYRSRNLHI